MKHFLNRFQSFLNVLTRRYLESIFSFIHFVISLFALFSRVWGVLAPFDGYCIEIHYSSRNSSKNSRNDRSFPRGSIWSSVCPCTKANPATRILKSFISAKDLKNSAFRKLSPRKSCYVGLTFRQAIYILWIRSDILVLNWIESESVRKYQFLKNERNHSEWTWELSWLGGTPICSHITNAI